MTFSFIIELNRLFRLEYMKIVTQDYGCGTSSSILDYGINDVVLVSPSNYIHIFDIEDDLFFVGHDFLLFLWDTKEKIDRWKNHKYSKVVWCFERIDSIVPIWRQKSIFSINCLRQFIDEIYVCDEDDIISYGFKWLPQWASPKFYNMKDKLVTKEKSKILFSGQARKPEYGARTLLLDEMLSDTEFKNRLSETNSSRTFSWDKYCNNLLSYDTVLNPVGILKGFNTRAYEVLYSGRLLLQHTFGHYNQHFELIKNCKNIVLFSNFAELKNKINGIEYKLECSDKFYNDNNIYARFESIGVEIK